MSMEKKFLKRTILKVMLMAAAAGVIMYFGFDRAKAQKQAAARENYASFSIKTMSTFASFQFYSDDPKYDFNPVFDTVRTELRKVESTCNYFDPESELGKLNQAAFDAPFVCSPDLWEVLSAARMYHKKTNGAFDVTITPFMKTWGFYRQEKKLPSPEALAETKKITGLDKVVFDDKARSVRFTVKGMSLNLGGIAKGWALDRIAAAVKGKYKLNKMLLNIGGNVLVLGGDFKVAIQDPFDKGKTCATFPLKDGQAVATSGNYERYVIIDGKHYTHIIDPRTGMPVENSISASVIAGSGMESDALSTSFFICGPDLMKLYPDYPVLLIDRKKDAPGQVDVIQSGDVWTLDIPVLIPPHDKD